MAKVKAPFTITGTIDDLNFYDSPDGNIVRMSGKTGVTKQQFRDNAIFDPIRRQGAAFGLCSRKAKIFKQMVQPFYKNVHAGSLFGRCIQLLLAILNEDTQNKEGNRQLINGLRTLTGLDFLLGFEGNNSRPIESVFSKTLLFSWEKAELNLTWFNPSNDIIWPENATQVHIQLAVADWDCREDFFETNYSDELVFDRLSNKALLSFELMTPKQAHLWLCFIHFKFSYTLYNKVKPLPNISNSVTLIGYRSFSEYLL
ncbi:hypothetical protein [Flavobacterium sp. 5]|uniref:hypothetical protein n=1 Tax=Flavobacterium sp. 5 TaxID=2035199 RepID=UPI000C2B8A5A|nr:hypothetical protein [Flavobacterium sp. 5]PKB17439.1 hypothetical protein CLU82_2639 [Flavobacterium sp. 5]